MWWNMSHDVICMPIEEGGAEAFCEEICHVYSCVNASEEEKISFYPFADDMILNVHVTCSQGRFLCHCHRGACIVIFIHD